MERGNQVMSSGYRTIVALILAVLPFLGGCMAVESAANLDGKWTLASVDGQSVAAGTNAPQFIIDGDTISGFDGCNQFGGQLSNPQAMHSGQRACAGDYLKLPLDLSDPKAHLDSASFEGDRLSLPARAGHPASVFVRQ